MTFFHWVQQFPNSHLFNDPKTLMYHQEHGDFFLKYSSPTTMAIRVVEFSKGGRGTKLERFLSKNQHTRRKLLNFEFWINGELSKSAKI